MNPNLRDAFWRVVRECLTRFHHLTEVDARDRVSLFRQHLDDAPADVPTDMVYHAEPFDVACNLAGNELDRIAFAKEYEELLDRHFHDTVRPPITREYAPGYVPGV